MMSNINIKSIHCIKLSFMCSKLKSVNEFHYLEAKPICKQTNKIDIVLTADGNTRQWIFQGYSVATKIYINLYSPISGSKEKKIYIHINTVKKQQKKNKKTASKRTCHYVVTCDNTILDLLAGL